MNRNKLCVLVVLWLILAAQCATVLAQPPYRRRLITTFTPAEQLQLRQLMMQYITQGIINEHTGTPGIHCENTYFLTWHRGYIGRLESWLLTQTNGSKYVPLPKWDPAHPSGIPNAFFNSLVSPGSAVRTGFAPLLNQNISTFGNFNFLPFTGPGVCTLYTPGQLVRLCTGLSQGTSLDNMARALERQHDYVHVNIGGVMGNFQSPAAAIFFLWHAYVDDLYRYYECTCSGAKGVDLYMKDNPEDVGDEPNTTAVDGVIWNSPDIWVRRNPDPLVSGRYQHQDDAARHEDPKYSVTNDNYVYVRVRNLGCEAVQAGAVKLRLYWTKASTGGLGWPADWTTLPLGSEITTVPVDVPAMDPGREWVAQIPWHVPNPLDYPTDPHHFCLLARLESTADPMAAAEGVYVGLNTRNNNNVCWRNVTVQEGDPFDPAVPADNSNVFFLKASTPGGALGTLEFQFQPNPAFRAAIDLGRELFAQWSRAGGKGRGIRVDGVEPNRVISIMEPGARIEGLVLSPGALYRPAVRMSMRNADSGGSPDVNYGQEFAMNVVQLEQGSGVEQLVGGITMVVRNVQSAATTGRRQIERVDVVRPSCPEAADGAIHLVMADSSAHYTYWWSNGANTRDVAELGPGTYTVTVRSDSGIVEQRPIALASRSTLDAEIDIVNPGCPGEKGMAWVAVSGGEGGYVYQWYQGLTPITGATGTSLTAVEGDYNVVVTDAAGCSVRRWAYVREDMTMLDVFMTVKDASGPAAADGSAEAEAVGMGPFRYTWSTGDTAARISGLRAGVYTVTVTDMMGCEIRKEIRIEGISGSADTRDAAIRLALTVTPNPAHDRIDVRYTLSRPADAKLEIYDEGGRRVWSGVQGRQTSGEHHISVDVRRFAAGRYFARLIVGGAVIAEPLVILRR